MHLDAVIDFRIWASSAVGLEASRPSFLFPSLLTQCFEFHPHSLGSVPAAACPQPGSGRLELRVGLPHTGSIMLQPHVRPTMAVSWVESMGRDFLHVSTHGLRVGFDSLHSVGPASRQWKGCAGHRSRCRSFRPMETEDAWSDTAFQQQGGQQG